MVKTPIFNGSCTALVTPFCKNGVDYERLAKNLDTQYENGTSAVVICGTTGENASLSEGEHNELIRAAVNAVGGRMKLIAGVGSNNTMTALKYAQNAKAYGADAILMVTPYYNKTTQKGLAEHFLYVADRVELPMILYNVPGRTGMSIGTETCRLLSKHPNINGIKEASGDISYAAEVSAACGEDLYIWSGNDSCTVPIMSLGGLGVISVASNLVPSVMSKLCALCLEGNYPAAAELSAKYTGLFSALFLETNPIPVKAAMRLLGTDSGLLRLPLVEMGEENKAKLSAQLRELSLI